MSLSNLFSKLKGGAGSGNIGHAGRVGHRGGSAPNSLHGAGVTYDQFIEGLDKKKIKQGKTIVAGFYNSTTGELTLPKGSASSHDYLAGQMAGHPGSTIIDENVHLTFNVNKSTFKVNSIVADTQQSGQNQGRYEYLDEDKAFKDIYRAMDKLIVRGFPKGTKVLIHNLKIDTVETSL